MNNNNNCLGAIPIYEIFWNRINYDLIFLSGCMIIVNCESICNEFYNSYDDYDVFSEK